MRKLSLRLELSELPLVRQVVYCINETKHLWLKMPIDTAFEFWKMIRIYVDGFDDSSLIAWPTLYATAWKDAQPIIDKLYGRSDENNQ